MAATASGGATIAPRAKAWAQPSPGMSHRAAAATAVAVTSTSTIASSPIARAFVL